MAKAATKETVSPGKLGDNIKGLYDTLREEKAAIDDLKKKRKAINDDIKARREKIEALGIAKEGYDFGVRLGELDPEKRKAVINALVISTEAFGAPIKGAQLDLGLAPAADAGEGE